MAESSNLIKITSLNFESELASFEEKGITEFTLQDSEILEHKGKLLKFLQTVEKKAPGLFVTLPVSASILDMDVVKACSNLFCTLEIPLEGISKGNTYLFDKKFFSKRAQMLNNFGLVFGFDLNFACTAGDSVKLFRDRLDFALSLYPNHIDFPQLEKNYSGEPSKTTATFSTQDIKMTKETAFACQTFYTYGRAVTWFLAVLAPLKMTPSKFFQDFAEWQNHNNCGIYSGWSIDSSNHKDVEKMQLAFLKFKYDEKKKNELFEVVSNIVRLNGALARCYGEGEESILDMNYNPDELLSGGAFDIQSFHENSFLENSRIKVFMGDDGPDFKYC
ncbi:MAG: hypothetical protein KBT11_04890 [Treponema sp.]|nr:hypothetical protein [Candidatus Treponema equifaecale]